MGTTLGIFEDAVDPEYTLEVYEGISGLILHITTKKNPLKGKKFFCKEADRYKISELINLTK